MISGFQAAFYSRLKLRQCPEKGAIKKIPNKKQREQGIFGLCTQITVYCPRCKGHNIKKNGFDDNQKQRYACKDCTRRFIGDHHLTYKGCHSQSDELIWKMTARGNGIRDICSMTGYSKDKVQAALQRSEHEIEPTQKHYDVLQVDEFHTFVGHKKNKVWLIYAYHQKTGQMVAFVWGKRDLKTAFE